MDLKHTKKKIPLVNHTQVINDALQAISGLVDTKNLYEGESPSMFGTRIGTYLRITAPIQDMHNVSDDDDENPLDQFDCPPFVDASVGDAYVSCKIGGRGGWHRTASFIYGGKNRKCVGFPKGVYVEFENDAKFESMINVLSILYTNRYKESVQPLREVIFTALNKVLSFENGSVELVGEEETVKKILATITNKDPRLINRHVLLHGKPGCGKSEIVKEVIRQTPEWIHYPLGCNSDSWEDFIKSLDKLMRFLGRSALIIADEIDENGLTRAVDREKVFKLLRVLDGVGDIGHVKFIATTNRASDLDEALLRVGRLSPAFKIEPPSKQKRKAIIQFYADRYNADADINSLCVAFKNASGATIRAAFESCVIFNQPLDTKNLISAYTEITESLKS
jgi:hypothetical protein